MKLTAAGKFYLGYFTVLAAGVCALLHGCSTAVSQTPTYAVQVTMPTQYDDGSALPLSDLASVTIVYKVNGGAAQTSVVTTLSAVVNTTIPKTLGTTCAAAFVTTKATAKAPNSSSPQTSPDVCVQFVGGPKAPTGLTVQ